MGTHTEKLGITNYFGYATVAIEWLAAITVLLIHPLNLQEPFSQYGYYADTKLLFGAFFTLAAVVYYLFSRNLDRYWRHTSKITLVGGIAFTITGWYTYTPYTQTYVLDLHNIAIATAILCYALPMLFISYSDAHRGIAAISRWMFTIVALLTAWSFVARLYDIAFIYTQLATLVTVHIWILMVSRLHLRHHRATHTL